jgi:putative addiction module component (TIGR02574 family)
MVKPTETILSQALALSEAERAVLVRRLIESLDDDVADGEPARDRAVEAAWAEEIQRRVEKMDRGETKFRPGHEVMADLRKKLQQRRDAPG